MGELVQILYREVSSDEFKKYVYIGTAYPENMYESPPGYETREDWEDLFAGDDFPEALLNLCFSLMLYYQNSDPFENLVFDNSSDELKNIVENWFWDIDVPIFQGLDLRDKTIQDSTFYDNGEHKEVKFLDGSEANILSEKNGFCGGYYVLEQDYQALLEDIADIRRIFSENHPQ